MNAAATGSGNLRGSEAFPAAARAALENEQLRRNLGRATADEPERVDENRRRLCAEVGADPDALAMNYQHHSADVLKARPAARGERADGLWTDERGLPVLALAVYVLGMLTGWAVVGLLRQSWNRVVESDRR